MKRFFILLYTLVFTSVSVLGCAKRENDISANSSNELQENLVNVEELDYLSHEKFEDCIGEKGNQLIIDADVIIPSKLVTGKVRESLPNQDEIAKILCDNQELKKVEVDTDVYEWHALGQDGNINKMYSQDDTCGLYTNGEIDTGVLDTNLMNSDIRNEMNNANQINHSEQILSDFGYSVKETNKQYTFNKDHYRLRINYEVLVENVPVVDSELGVDYTHVVIYDDVITQVGFAKNYELVDSNNTKILPLDKLIVHIKNLYTDGMIQLPGEKVNKVQLMYYVDSNDQLIPVWTFFSNVFDNNDETVIAFFDAKTGSLLYDECNGKVVIDE